MKDGNDSKHIRILAGQILILASSCNLSFQWRMFRIFTCDEASTFNGSQNISWNLEGEELCFYFVSWENKGQSRNLSKDEVWLRLVS